MTVTSNEKGQQNVWAKEPEMVVENITPEDSLRQKEIINGRWAMVGIIGAFISYLATGKLFFGVF